MDEAGTVLATGQVPHTAEGLDHLVTTIRTQAPTPHDICVALETSQGPLAGRLLDEGFTLYPINPKAVDRHRERFRVAGAKSDLRDAWVLANLLRTDRALYHPLRPDSDTAQELKVLTRDRATLVQTRTMLSNQLTACLKAYFPEFLRLCADPDRPATLALLQTYPTLDALRAAAVEELTAVLRQQRYPNAATKAQEIFTTVRQPAFRINPVLVRTKARLAQTLAQQLRVLHEQIVTYEAEIQRVLNIHPDGALYLSLPGASHCLAARMVGELATTARVIPTPRSPSARLALRRSPKRAAALASSEFDGLASVPCGRPCGCSPSVVCAIVRGRERTTRGPGPAASGMGKPSACWPTCGCASSSRCAAIASRTTKQSSSSRSRFISPWPLGIGSLSQGGSEWSETPCHGSRANGRSWSWNPQPA